MIDREIHTAILLRSAQWQGKHFERSTLFRTKHMTRSRQTRQ
jgi:hypothetical protein